MTMHFQTYIIKPYDASGEVILRAKTSVKALVSDTNAVTEKMEYSAKRAGLKCARVEVIDEEGAVVRIWEPPSKGKAAQPEKKGKPAKVAPEPKKQAPIEKKEEKAESPSEAKYRSDGKKSGKNGESRKATIRNMYMAGEEYEDCKKKALALGIKLASFKSWWGEFNRLQYPRKGIR